MMNTRTINSTLDRMLTLNRALDEAFSATRAAGARVWVPAIDVVEKRDAYVLFADLPGVASSSIDISFEQNVLTLRGSKPASVDPSTDGELRVFAAERVSGTFERSLRLPEFVDGDRISASFVDGLLTVTIPKAQAAQPRRIEVKAAGASAQVAS